MHTWQSRLKSGIFIKKKIKKKRPPGFIQHCYTKNFYFFFHLDDHLLKINMIRKGWDGKWGQEKEPEPRPGCEDVLTNHVIYVRTTGRQV